RLYVGSAPAPNTIDALIMAPQNSVGWLSHALETEQLTQDTDALFGAMTRISSSADEFSDLPALKQAALRCLVVHVWRRIALKIPELPRELHSNRWKGHDCRQLVFDFLQAVPRPSLDELTQE
ncbi:MAG: PaaX family transcriptional regulator C-terminal domain-containing protein, partial [Pseudomonadota bacterium]